jgi:hypothetical protein
MPQARGLANATGRATSRHLRSLGIQWQSGKSGKGSSENLDFSGDFRANQFDNLKL